MDTIANAKILSMQLKTADGARCVFRGPELKSHILFVDSV